MKKQLILSASAAALALGLAIPASAAELGATDEPIKLAINEWTGQHITTHVAGNILERMGYQVEYVTAGYFPQFQAMQDGTLHASLEIWSNNIGDNFTKAEAAGTVVHIGNLGLDTNEGWVYPKHMEEICPGLPDWEALTTDECVAALQTAETFPNARLLDYPADWGDRSELIIDGMELPLTSVRAGSEGALVAELKAAQASGSPLLMMMWAPHWVFAEVEVGWVDLPAYDPACMEDPSWGPNPNATNDCGVDVAITFKTAWAGMEEKWPAAYEFLKAFQFEAADQEPMMAAIDVNGEDITEVTAAWVEENQDKWQGWADAATQ